MPFLLNLISRKLVCVSQSLSSYMTRNFLKMSLKCVEPHFERNAVLLGLRDAIPALHPAVSSRPLICLDPSCLLLEY